MELYDLRFNEICAKYTLTHLMKEGVSLRPLELKREIKNRAKELGISDKEMAESTKIILNFLYKETIKKIDEIISGKVEE